ncbi:RNA polymerase-associated protein LEO1-like isoform X2 [Octopus sinensis]|nr:RNA polymerase-associated protein LEO1-like isoform X2 [Octopus sinensis]
MRLLITLAIISVVVMVCCSHPMEMRKKKDGDEKAMPLNTDRNSHAVKRAKEVLMFGNQQNSPRVKKSDTKPDKEVPLTGLNSDEDSKEHRLTGDPDDDGSNTGKSSSTSLSSSSSSSSSSEELKSEPDDVDENKTEEDAEKKPEGLLGDDHNDESDDDDDSNSNDDDGVPDSGSHDHDNNDEDEGDDSDEEEDDDDDMLNDEMEQELVNNDSDDDQDDDEDNNKYRASKKSSDLPLFPEDSMDPGDTSSKLNSYALTEELPLMKPEEEMIPERELPELVKAGLQPSQQNSYEHLMQEYENEPIDVQRERSFQENPLLNYIYRRRRELQDRSPRTKRGLYLSEDSQRYMPAEMPEKLVSLDSWPNAYTQSELLEKEAPYQIDNSELEGGYGYDKRLAADFERENERESTRDEIDEESLPEESEEEDINMPYEEVVLNGQPGYFIPAKRVFFPYSEEPRSHYSGLVGNKRSEPDEDVDYSRLLELARALAVQRDGNAVAKDEDSFAEK